MSHRSFQRRLSLTFGYVHAAVFRLVLTLGAALPSLLQAAAAPEPLTSVAAIRKLAPDVAERGLPVRVRVVITRCTHYEIYCQQGTDGIFVAPDPTRELYQLGDIVEFVGTTAPGHFLPMIMERQSHLIAHGPLPDPIPAKYDQLASGEMDCRYVAVEGVVRSARGEDGGVVKCVLAMGHALLRVDLAYPPANDTPLFGATVRLSGVVGGIKNSQRQIVQPIVWVTPSTHSIQVLSAPPADVFDLPLQPIAQLMSAFEAARPAHLVKITGQVTWRESGTHVYVRDDTDSVEVNLQASAEVDSGDRIAVVGFPETGMMKPHLSDAVIRILGRGERPIPRRSTAAQLLSRGNEASLVEIVGVVRNRYENANATLLDLSEGAIAFRAVVPRASGHELAPIGARVAVTGICKIDQTKWTDNLLVSATAFELEARTPADVRLLSAPPFWTTRKLLIAVGGLAATLLFAAGWIWSLRRTVSRQTRLLVGKTRTEATREERDRIARELHDSLEQQLAGATILLDATAAAWEQTPETAKTQLDAARALLRYSLDEAQRAVLDLRDPDLLSGDLINALQQSLRRVAAPFAVRLTFETQPVPHRLDAIAANHVLRIAQEAVTNALKHGAPNHIVVKVAVDGSDLRLSVRDDGCGFTPSTGVPPAVGKFGLIGLRERAEKLHGKLSLQSAPRAGTEISLVIPLQPNLAHDRA